MHSYLLITSFAVLQIALGKPLIAVRQNTVTTTSDPSPISTSVGTAGVVSSTSTDPGPISTGTSASTFSSISTISSISTTSSVSSVTFSSASNTGSTTFVTTSSAAPATTTTSASSTTSSAPRYLQSIYINWNYMYGAQSKNALTVYRYQQGKNFTTDYSPAANLNAWFWQLPSFIIPVWTTNQTLAANQVTASQTGQYSGFSGLYGVDWRWFHLNYRYVAASYNSSSSAKPIRDLALLRSSYANATLPSGWSNASQNLNAGRGGDYLYVIWKV